MAADIDVRTISTFSSLPENTINTLLDEPTVELVKSLLQSIGSKAKEYEQSRSQKIKLEVELETVVRTGESKVKVLQNSRDKALADSSKLRVDLQSSENARSRLESELEQFRSATQHEASETTSLRSRISSLEAANRDTLALLESKTTANDKLSQDLSAQYQKATELRRQISTLEQSVQTANSSVASARFREQSLQQEIDLLKKNNEWLESERSIKAEEHTKFRREKNSRISELSRLNEQFISEAETLKRSESALKHRYDEQNTKYEESLQEIQKIREEKDADADTFRIELESVNRLAELQKASADTAKQRVNELSIVLEEAREEAADEIGRIRAEVETEHGDKEAAEQRIAELEAANGQLRSEVEQARVRPMTPQQQPVNGTGLSTPIRPGTPVGIFSPSSASRLKGNVSTTQLYSEYKKLEKELAGEKRTNEQLQSNLDAMLEDLEASKPEIDELRADHSRMQGELMEMSALVDKAKQERDQALKELRTHKGQLEAKIKESEVLAQQLRDSGAQIRYLLIEQHVREQGDTLTRDDLDEIQRNADEAMRLETENLSETQRVVNQQLIVFKSITELQQQNENQLKTIRNLVENLENRESRDMEKQRAALRQELETAQAQVSRYQDEISTMVAQSQSFVKERDMFRNMLTRRGQLSANIDPTDFSRSLPLPAGESPAREGTSVTGGESDYAKLLKDLQQHFDSYRQEAATDHSALKKQVDDLSKRNAQLQTEASRALGQLTGANQRCDMLQSNFTMLKTENTEIQKRSYAAMENATRQELKTQQAAEELVETRGLIDSVRRESANLKAEKDLFKNIEKRLIEDNESLRNERSRLDQLNGSLQNIMNEREQTESETRRRLHGQVESLESELQSSKRKLNDEIEEAKKAALRREYEHEQSQKRIDDLVTSLSSTREDLAAAKTARDHLQARVDELGVELRSAEERVEVLTRSTAPASEDANTGAEGLISHEQELAVEVSELKRDLDLKTSELDRANEQVEVYKGISQSSEERLQEVIETNDQYKEETDATIAERDSKIKDLEHRIEDISSELRTTNTELSQLRDEQSESNRKLDEQKSSLESEIERLKDQAEKNAELAQFHLATSKEQAKIATEAQQSYETELLKHAEATQTLHTIRSETSKIRLEMVDLKSRAENAHNILEQKESSWSEMKDRYDTEVSDLKKRREEVLQQNTLLHQQLENVTKQITALQRDRALLATDETVEAPAAGLDNLQEVITYLRREKEIVDVQYHLSTQEAKRLRQQLDFAQSQLDESRLKLDQRRRAEADSERNAMSQNKLLETLNELNLFRESSVTLRAEAKQASQALSEKTQLVERLEGQMQPLQTRISELENLAELREGEMKLLQDDRDHWQQRTQNILSKYDRVDPAELEALKSKLAELEGEKDEAVAAQTELQNQIDAIPDQVETAKSDLRTRLGEQFKTRSKELSARIKDKQNEVDSALADNVALQQEIDVLREQLESAQNNTDAPASHQVNGELEKSVGGNGGIEAGEVEDSTGMGPTINHLMSLLEEREIKINKAQSQQDQIVHSKEVEWKASLEKRLAEVRESAEKAKNAALDELRKSLTATHQQELEALRAQSVPVASGLQNVNKETAQPGAQTATTEVSNEMLDELSESQSRYLIQKNETIRTILKNNIRNAVEKAKDAVRKELTNGQPNLGEEVSSGQVQEVERKFAAEKENIIQEKELEFANQKDTLIKQHQETLAREKQELIVQHQESLVSEKLRFSEESERKIAEQVSNAEKLAEKRSTVKLNMAQNQSRIANAKLDVVKKAAEETPEKAVGEVWEVAKDAKPLPAAPQAAKPSVASPAPKPTDPGPTAPVVTNDTASKVEKAEPQPAVEQSIQDPSQQTAADGVLKPAQGNLGAGPAALRSLQSSLPRGAGSFRGRGGAQPPQQQNQQPAATRGTGIPRGGGGAGRGAGRGRGQPQQTGIPQSSGARSVSAAGNSNRGALNPQATQFNPGGNKRNREDGEVDDTGNMGKRIRGGGVGAT